MKQWRHCCSSCSSHHQHHRRHNHLIRLRVCLCFQELLFFNINFIYCFLFRWNRRICKHLRYRGLKVCLESLQMRLCQVNVINEQPRTLFVCISTCIYLSIHLSTTPSTLSTTLKLRIDSTIDIAARMALQQADIAVAIRRSSYRNTSSEKMNLNFSWEKSPNNNTTTSTTVHIHKYIEKEVTLLLKNITIISILNISFSHFKYRSNDRYL